MYIPQFVIIAIMSYVDVLSYGMRFCRIREYLLLEALMIENFERHINRDKDRITWYLHYTSK